MSAADVMRRARNGPSWLAGAVRGGEAALIGVLTLLATACSAERAGRPEIVVDRTACSQCGMLVSEAAYAAGYQRGASDRRVFDDIGCMLEAARGEAATPSRFWFQDAAGSGWLEADEAIFVASPHVRTPMNGGVLAYADPAEAEKAAKAHAGEVVRSFTDLMRRRGDMK